MQTILLIDDSAEIRDQVSSMVESLDRTVVHAGNGSEGLKKLYERPEINMVICDVNMPVLDGIAFIERLNIESEQGLVKRIPVVILTAESAMEKVMRAKKAGILGWMIKPPKQEIIDKLLEKILPL